MRNVRACVCVCTMHIYRMHLLNLARGRRVGLPLWASFEGDLSSTFLISQAVTTSTSSSSREIVGSGNILPFNFRVPPLTLCTVAADVVGIELSVVELFFRGRKKKR